MARGNRALMNSTPSLRILLLIPAYNEERRIEPTIRGYAEYFG
jgi:hypothetical protein